MKNQTNVSHLDIVVLLDNLIKGADEPKVGHLHADKTLKEVVDSLSGRVWIPDSAFEDAMWAAVMMEEAGKFQHPLGKPYQAWFEQVTKTSKTKYNVNYNWVERE